MQDKDRGYHEIFVPFPQVYRLGGRDAVKEFERDEDGEKNLLAIPYSFLEDLEKEESMHFSGANDLLDHIKKLEIEETDGGVALYKDYEGLDIAIIHQEIKDDDMYLKNLNNFIKDRYKHDPVFISKDPLKHIKLKGLDLKIEDPTSLQVEADIVNEGIIEGNDELCSVLNSERSISLEDACDIMGRELFINQFIRFRSLSDNSSKDQYAIVTGNFNKNSHGEIISSSDEKIQLINEKEKSKKIRIGELYRDNIFGIKPLDMEQYLAMQYGLLNPNIQLFFLCGSQGSGKTLLSYVSAVDNVLWYDAEIRKKRYPESVNDKKGGLYKQIVLLKPNDIIGGAKRNIGHLPGSMYEKLKPHLAPYIDSHNESSLGHCFPFEDMIKHPKFEKDFGKRETKDKKIEEGYLNPHSEVIEVTYSGFMRGRSFLNMLLLIDEAQNFTPYEVKTMCERVGVGSKAIIMGVILCRWIILNVLER